MKTQVAFALAVAICQPAAAQSNCAPQPIIDAMLTEQHGEAVVAAGVDAAGNLLRVFSATGGAWTITVTRAADALTCVVASGEGWQAVTAAPTGRPS